jgi:hypothetical protein
MSTVFDPFPGDAEVMEEEQASGGQTEDTEAPPEDDENEAECDHTDATVKIQEPTKVSR